MFRVDLDNLFHKAKTNQLIIDLVFFSQKFLILNLLKAANTLYVLCLAIVPNKIYT